MNKACERIVDALRVQRLHKSALWTAVNARDAADALAKPLRITQAEFEKAVLYLVEKEFTSWADDLPDVLEIVDEEADM